MAKTVSSQELLLFGCDSHSASLAASGGAMEPTDGMLDADHVRSRAPLPACATRRAVLPR